MCLIFLSINKHPIYKLIVAGNRDEFYTRPTAPAGYWSDFPRILAGRDLEAGGTWMGMNLSGKIAMLTNYRDPLHIDPKAPSRGDLVSDYLKEKTSPGAYLDQLVKNGKQYNGYNLLVGDTNELWYHSNYKEGIQKLEPGFYGISNHLLETPWPKVIRGKQKLGPVLENPHVKLDEIFDILYDDQEAPMEQLPSTGLTLERERALSSMFIKTANYGSRCTTIAMVDRNNEVLYAERLFNTSTFEHETHTFTFKAGTP